MTDVWAPVSMLDIVMRASGPSGIMLERGAPGFLVVGGRLKRGVSVAQAASEIEAIARGIERDHPDLPGGRRLRLSKSSPIPEQARLPVGAFLALLMVVVSVVLVIACANVAGVLMARATARRREIAVRLAIGAGRARLVRQLLTETLLLFALGSGAGLLLARITTSLIVGLMPAVPLPINVALPLDRRALAFTTGLSLVAAVLSGLAPALHASRADVVAVLKNDAQGLSERTRLPSAFVVAQVAFSILLVVAAGLLVRALGRASAIDPGFDPHGVELTELDLSLAGYTESSGRAFVRDALDRVQQIPDVKGASAAALLPMGGGMRGAMTLGGLTVPGLPLPEGEASLPAFWNVVEPRYFATLGIPLLAGRDFSAADTASAPLAAIVGEATARRLWPDRAVQDAVGQIVLVQFFHDLRSRRRGGSMNDRPATNLVVVGIARDVKYTGLRQDKAPLFVYVPFEQQYTREITIVVRSAHGQRTAAASVCRSA